MLKIPNVRFGSVFTIQLHFSYVVLVYIDITVAIDSYVANM